MTTTAEEQLMDLEYKAEIHEIAHTEKLVVKLNTVAVRYTYHVYRDDDWEEITRDEALVLLK